MYFTRNLKPVCSDLINILCSFKQSDNFEPLAKHVDQDLMMVRLGLCNDENLNTPHRRVMAGVTLNLNRSVKVYREYLSFAKWTTDPESQ